MPLIQIINPLEWPQSRPQTDRLMRSNDNNFKQDMADHEALAFLQEEINNIPLDVASAVLSLDALNVSSPLPTQYLSKNNGVCLKLTMEQHRYFLACDRWQKLAHNLYALHLCIRYCKQLVEWGLGNLHTVMGGFSDQYLHHVHVHGADPKDSDSAHEDWMKILGLGPTATVEDANAVYRHRALKIGEEDSDALQELNLAIAKARKYLGHSHDD